MQNSTRGVLFGPIQGYSENNRKLSAKPANKLSQKKKTNFRTRLCSGVNQLFYLKNYVQRAKTASGIQNNRKILPKNKNGENHLLEAKQTRREPFILHYSNKLCTRSQIQRESHEDSNLDEE